MPDSPNKLSQFWQELRRRRVVHVIVVYATAAFVIIELVNNVYETLNLPDWTPALTLIILAIGFPLAIIFSWIFDVTPEGIEKTEPSKKGDPVEKSSVPKSWKIASYISFVVIVALIILNVIPRRSNRGTLEKSIAVLPFINDSPNQERMYFINGTMEAILDNLSTIEDLRIPGRTSIEQYRNNPKPISTVAKEMNVSYVLEGSGHRDGNNVKLFIQLLDGKKDQHLWSRSYDAGIEEIFAMQSEIAQLVAAEIKAIITPEEKQIIERIPTTNLTAHDFYLRGKDELWKYNLEDDKAALGRAERLFYKALEHDSTFAQVYIGLADISWDRNYTKDYFTESFLDSFLILTNIAISHDDQLAEGYRYRGVYFEAIGKPEQALAEYNKALEYNPGWRVYGSREGLGSEDQIQRIKDLEKANSLNQGTQKSISLRGLGGAYLELGFIEKGMHYYREAFALDRDSSAYLRGLVFAEFSQENFEKPLEILRKLNELDSTFMPAPIIYNLTGHHQELYSLYMRIGVGEGSEYSGWGPLVSSHRIGVALWKMGEYEMAKSYFNLQIELCNESIKLGRSIVTSRAAYYDLAGAYAWLGENEKALHYLNEYNKKQFIPLWWVIQTKVDPLFEPIRDKPEFQQIVKEVEAKYQAEHEGVRKWLEENDML